MHICIPGTRNRYTDLPAPPHTHTHLMTLHGALLKQLISTERVMLNIDYNTDIDKRINEEGVKPRFWKQEARCLAAPVMFTVESPEPSPHI